MSALASSAVKRADSAYGEMSWNLKKLDEEGYLKLFVLAYLLVAVNYLKVFLWIFTMRLF